MKTDVLCDTLVRVVPKDYNQQLSVSTRVRNSAAAMRCNIDHPAMINVLSQQQNLRNV